MDPKTKKMLMIGCGILTVVVIVVLIIYLNRPSATSKPKPSPSPSPSPPSKTPPMPAASTPVNNNVPSGQLPQVGKKFVLKCVNGNGYIIGVVPVGYTPNKQNATIYTIDDKQNLSPTWGGVSQYPISLVQNSSKTNTLILLTGQSNAIVLAPTPVGYEIASVDDALSPTYVSDYAVTAEYL